VQAKRLDLEELDWDEDVVQRRCRYCKRRFYVQRGRKVRHCPHCGAAQIHGAQTRLRGDPRWAQQL
jgi:predicted RNA-binding Zn-ribbon protein involved in translation (DUF1610 family)